MQSQDIVVLLKLVSLETQIRQGSLEGSMNSDPFALRSLEAALGISKTEIGASLQRSVAATLAIKSNDRPKVNRRNLTEFVTHGLKCAFPAKPGARRHGIATGFAAPMLQGQLASSGADIHVWPYRSSHRGNVPVVVSASSKMKVGASTTAPISIATKRPGKLPSRAV